MHYKTYCFALQKSRFRNVKAQLSLFNTIFFTKKGDNKGQSIYKRSNKKPL